MEIRAGCRRLWSPLFAAAAPFCCMCSGKVNRRWRGICARSSNPKMHSVVAVWFFQLEPIVCSVAFGTAGHLFITSQAHHQYRDQQSDRVTCAATRIPRTRGGAKMTRMVAARSGSRSTSVGSPSGSTTLSLACFLALDPTLIFFIPIG